MRLFAKKVLFGCVLLAAFFATKVENNLVDTAPAVRKVPTSQKVVALTFDDGPLSITTPEILGVLKEKNVKATFFVVGERAKRFPELVQQEVTDGHEVGNHTYDHPKLTDLNGNQVGNELAKTEEEVAKVAPKLTLFRPPGGKYNNTILKIARERGYIIVLWSIDTYDWRSPPVGEIVNSVVKDVKPGSIILCHDGKYPSPTPEAIEFIIDDLRARGYEFVTVSELLQYYEAKP